MDVDKALATQLANIEKRSGKSLAELAAIIAGSGLSKHGELVAMLKADLGLGHGDANTVVHTVKQAATPAPAAGADPLDAIYTGASAALRPIHERLMKGITAFGPFEIAPKKGYVSLRRKKQFAMLGPGTKTLLEIGLNAKRDELGQASPGCRPAACASSSAGSPVWMRWMRRCWRRSGWPTTRRVDAGPNAMQVSAPVPEALNGRLRSA
ncbi:DUF4287 domain-containing protein [Arenimonas daejeonensis]|uniref:DUF4287 domain-containing protein n=1 Tax=Arenimonas daejeonensis TaxID=370777 RepID=UPI001D144454|nr:DUF4287 domain-containing protein [Arenimonas daejeonensis]